MTMSMTAPDAIHRGEVVNDTSALAAATRLLLHEGRFAPP